MKTLEIGFPGGKKISASVGNHTVVTDQPASNGGEDMAMSPFDLFWASLATCAGFYAAEFCKRRNISMEGFALRMHCHAGEQSKMYERVQFELTLPPGFPADQVESLKRSIDSCAVKKHVVNAPAFEIVTLGG